MTATANAIAAENGAAANSAAGRRDLGLKKRYAAERRFRLLGAAAAACMAQAPALLALALGWEKIRTALPASLLIGLGCLLFACDLVFRSRLGHGLFPMAAPTGGSMMILGWIAVGLGAFLRR